jgi:DNA-binding HxlR family transcriptional regulator
MIMYVQDTLYVFGGKWSANYHSYKTKEIVRFTDIRPFISKITNRVLSKELKELEVNKSGC